AAFRTNSTFRLRYATTTRFAAQKTVDHLLKRRKNSSDREGARSLRAPSRGFTKSIVETDASEVNAELTDDMAAERIATMRKPLSQCGTSVSMKIGKTKSFALMPGRVSGIAMPSGWL